MKKQLTIFLCFLIYFSNAQTLEVTYLEKSNLLADINIFDQLETSSLPAGMGKMIQEMIESINNDSYIEEKVINIMAGYIVGEIKYTL